MGGIDGVAAGVDVLDGDGQKACAGKFRDEAFVHVALHDTTEGILASKEKIRIGALYLGIDQGSVERRLAYAGVHGKPAVIGHEEFGPEMGGKVAVE